MHKLNFALKMPLSFFLKEQISNFIQLTNGYLLYILLILFILFYLYNKCIPIANSYV